MEWSHHFPENNEKASSGSAGDLLDLDEHKSCCRDDGRARSLGRMFLSRCSKSYPIFSLHWRAVTDGVDS